MYGQNDRTFVTWNRALVSETRRRLQLTVCYVQLMGLHMPGHIPDIVTVNPRICDVRALLDTSSLSLTYSPPWRPAAAGARSSP